MTSTARPGSRPWLRAAAGSALAALLLSGCGSTALRGGSRTSAEEGLDAAGSSTGTQADGGAGGSTTGQALPGATSGAATAGGEPGSTGVSVPGGGSGTGSVANGSGTTPGGSGGASGGSGSTPGTIHGDLKPITVGVTTANLGAIAAAFGKKPSVNDGQNAFLNYMNQHGGIGGHKIIPVYYQADSASDATTSAQQACAKFTQDNKVDVVLDGVIGGDVLPSCLQKQGIAMFTAANTTQDATYVRSHPNLIQPAAMQIDRQIKALLQVSAALKTLKRGDKLGVMVENCPYAGRVYNNVLLPFAKQLGVSVTQSSVTCLTNLVQDLVPISQDISRAALTFASSGVTRVMAIDSAEAFLIANFTVTASSQQYHPHYLVTSNAYPWGNSQSDATVKINADALPNITGVGYLPLLDVGTGANPSAAQKALQAKCTAADPTELGAASETDSGKFFKRSVFFSGCDAAFAMKATLEAAGMRYGYRDLTRAFFTLKQRGTGSAVLNSGRLGGPADALDGVGFTQAFAYNTARKTFAYVGSPMAIN